MTKGLKISIHHKRDLYLRCKYSNDQRLKNDYKTYCKILSTLIILAKHLQYNKQISNSNNKPKTLWNIVNLETGKNRRKEQISLLHTRKSIIRDPPTIANAFNNYFLTVAGNLLNTTLKSNRTQIVPMPLSSRPTPYPSTRFNYTSTSEVENIIKALKPKDAKGYDEIPIKVLKWCAPFISSPMTYIFNKSIQKGTFPSRLKYSTIIPNYKSGDKLDMSNFRPISILICISKILEKIIYNRIYSHITINNILTKDQFGFRNNMSTDNASYTLLH
jgi:hypothetical protein